MQTIAPQSIPYVQPAPVPVTYRNQINYPQISQIQPISPVAARHPIVTNPEYQKQQSQQPKYFQRPQQNLEDQIALQQYTNPSQYERVDADRPDQWDDQWLDRLRVREGIRGGINGVLDWGTERADATLDWGEDTVRYAWQQRPGPQILNQQSPGAQGAYDGIDEATKLSTEAIIGIAAGGVCVLALCVGSLCYFLAGSRKPNRQPQESQMGNMQVGPNFDYSDNEDIYGPGPYGGKTFDTSVTHNQQQSNRKEGDATYGSYLAGY